MPRREHEKRLNTVIQGAAFSLGLGVALIVHSHTHKPDLAAGVGILISLVTWCTAWVVIVALD